MRTWKSERAGKGLEYEADKIQTHISKFIRILTHVELNLILISYGKDPKNCKRAFTTESF